MTKKHRRRRDNQPKQEMPRVCAFCDKSVLLKDKDSVLCSKIGVVSCDHVCRRFRYDPLKRVPNPPPPIVGLSPEDLII
ncbi:MAG: hypothetical protein PHZ09_12560 [Eubacteriales bacterium]|jgi:hypothetical protein|nr:hypothetical protein [Eubacteriales bacterium]